jgi:hypothetical protein
MPKSKVPIKWNISDEMVARYANNVVVNHSETEVVISFFETLPPLLLDKSEPLPEHVDAHCVARIVMTPRQAMKFLGALQKNLATYVLHYGTDDSEDVESENEDGATDTDSEG